MAGHEDAGVVPGHIATNTHAVNSQELQVGNFLTGQGGREGGRGGIGTGNEINSDELLLVTVRVMNSDK